MRELVAVGVGGFIGAATRYVLSGWIQLATARHPFPFGTLVVNVVGSFFLGLLFHYCQTRGVPGALIREFALIGILGAFTTFSAFSLESVDLILSGDRMLFSLNIFANVGLCLVGVFCARLLGVAIWSP